jgi:thymidylate kinase
MQKIAIIGVHSAGKTSLAYTLSAHFKMQELNVKLIHESVRENCPFPINAEANQGTCLWNFHTQFINELDAEAQGYQLAICDRSVMDTFVYFHAVNSANEFTLSAENQAAEWLSTYDTLICLEPVENVELHDDGIRSTDREYQKLIRDEFRKTIGKYEKLVADKIVYATSDDVFNQLRREKLLQKIESIMGVPVT